MKFLLGAWNEGDFSEADKHIAPDIEIYTNGLSLSSEHGGPAMAEESIESWRALAPDLRMELSQEIGEKHRIAIEFRITGTHTGDVPELPASGGAIDVEHRVPDAQRRQGHRGPDGLRFARARGPDGRRRGSRLVAGALVSVPSAFACLLSETIKHAVLLRFTPRRTPREPYVLPSGRVPIIPG